MKKIFPILTAIMLLISGCHKTYDLDGASLGMDKGDFIVPLYNSTEIINEEGNTLTLEGRIPLFGTIWKKGIFTFDNKDRLVKLYVLKTWSNTSDSEIDHIKSIMRDNCGGAYVDYASKTTTYGTEHEKECQGALSVIPEDDAIFVGIELINP